MPSATPVPVVTQLSMEEQCPRVRFDQSHIRHLPNNESRTSSIPTANGVDRSPILSQLDSNVQEAVSSLLSLADAPSALQLPDNDWVFEPVADFDPPSPDLAYF